MMTRQTTLLFAMLAFCGGTTLAQMADKQLDKQAIKDMCGCYEIEFKYTETFAPEIDYEKKLDYTAAALEWAQVIEEDDDKVSIQHLLVVNDTMVVKHWRQDWEYENQELFTYWKDNTWKFKDVSDDAVEGEWSQKVFQVDDSPRYAGSSIWVHHGDRSYWENKSSSPLPRREYTKRDDYNVMMRGNHIELMDSKWIHEQDNDKVIRKNGEDKLLVQEKGYNTYKKVPDERCKLAQDWWKENNALWGRIRSVWSEVYDEAQDEGVLSLKKQVNGKPLFMQLFDLEQDATENEIREIIQPYAVYEK